MNDSNDSLNASQAKMNSSSGDRQLSWNGYDFAKMAAEMRAAGIRRIKTIAFEMEISPLPAQPQPTAEADPEKDEFVCPCSHHLVTEHNETGCLHGCAHELCTSKDGEEPKP